MLAVGRMVGGTSTAIISGRAFRFNPRLFRCPRQERINLSDNLVDLRIVKECLAFRKERRQLKGTTWMAALLLIGGMLPSAHGGQVLGPLKLKLQNARFHGQIVEFTDYHGADHRIWSSALAAVAQSLRLPAAWFRSGQTISDRAVAARNHRGRAGGRCIDAVPYFDRAIAKGRMPPVIVAIPDGHIPGSFFDSHFLNIRSGRYEDYLLQDVLPFVEAHFPVRPERQAHAIMGFSLSGWAAYSVALKNTARFGAVVGILPPLNMRLGRLSWQVQVGV